MEKNQVNVALIASGSGTDAQAIMRAYRLDQIANIDLKLLISTKTSASCLKKAEESQITSVIIDRAKFDSAAVFNRQLISVLARHQIELVILVGCIVKIPNIEDITVYNIHPADTDKYGGKGLYGLEPHRRVLLDIKDLIDRGRKTTKDKFYTCPTFHEVNNEYDAGQYLLKINVEIPAELILKFLRNPQDIEAAAQELQKYVLPYEWLVLPFAVKVAANKILAQQK